MSSKRINHDEAARFEEESYSEEEYDDYDDDHSMEHDHVEMQERRSQAPVTGSALLAAGGAGHDEQELSPAQAAAIAANLPGAGAGAGSVRRRGRGPSKRPCLNRNAQMARENRQRKKVYLKTIEDKLNEYHAKNKGLVNLIEKQNKQIEELAKNVRHYQALVANQSEITTLLTALNEALRTIHGKKDVVPRSLSSNVAIALQNVNQTVDDFKWSQSLQAGASNPGVQSAYLSAVRTSDLGVNRKEVDGAGVGRPTSSFGMINPSTNIARKTMPLNSAFGAQNVPKTEQPSSVESVNSDLSSSRFEQSPESHSYCEYNAMDTGPSGRLSSISSSGNQLVATSNSLEPGEASLSETDLEALSGLNVDSFLFDDIGNAPESPNTEVILPDEASNSNLDEFFQSIDAKAQGATDVVDDMLGEVETSKFNRSLFNTLNPPTGICLHINSSRVSLEYCYSCYERSLAKHNDSDSQT